MDNIVESLKALKCLAENASGTYKECENHVGCDDCPFNWTLEGAKDCENIDVIAKAAADALTAITAENERLKVIIEAQRNGLINVNGNLDRHHSRKRGADA
jgi:formylmethanofuran dehydrogenase subunit C